MLWAPERLAELTMTRLKLAPILAAFQEMVPITRARIGEERLRWLAGASTNAFRGRSNPGPRKAPRSLAGPHAERERRRIGEHICCPPR